MCCMYVSSEWHQLWEDHFVRNLNWRLKDEENIRSLKRSNKAYQYGKAKFPVMENELYTKFLDMQKKGKHVKIWWFNSKTRDLVKEKYPGKHPPLDHRWFQGFRRRYKISLRRQTHATQKSSAALHTAIEKFHAGSLQGHKRGIFTIKGLGNMDQTLLFFAAFLFWAYEKTGADEIWIASGQSGFGKRRCTVQLTIFADGSALLRILIFLGKVLRIRLAEKNQWDRRVKVTFQPNAGCAKATMKKWVEEDWNNILLYPPTARSSSKILYADVHRAQQTPYVKHWLHKCKTTLINVPGGTMCSVQSLDLSILTSHSRIMYMSFLNKI